MKTLPPKTRYQCDYCGRRYLIRSACMNHEFKCYKNPERNCTTCDNSGQEYIGTPGDMDMYRNCHSCEIAGIYGGKSFIQEKLP